MKAKVKYLMLVLCICGYSSLKSQIKSEVTTPEKYKSPDLPSNVIEFNDNYVIASHSLLSLVNWVSFEGDKTIIQKTKINKKSLAGAPFTTDGNIQQIRFIKNKKNKSLDEVLISYNDKFEITDEKVIAQTDLKKGKQLPKQQIKKSDNGKYTFLYAFADDDKLSKKFWLTCNLFDDTGRHIFHKDIGSHYDAKQYHVDVKGVIVDDEGTSYILLHNKEDRIHSYDFVVIDKQGETEYMDVHFESEHVHDARLYQDGTSPVIVFMRGNSFEKNAFPIGLEVKRYCNDTGLDKSSLYSFSIGDFEKMYLGNLKEKPTLKSLDLTDNFVVTSEGLFFLAEEHYNKYYKTTTFYYHGLGVMFQLKEDKLNIHPLSKHTLLTRPIAASKLIKHKDKPILVYQDALENFDRDLADFKNYRKKKLFTIDDTGLGMFTFSDGQWNRYTIENTKNYYLLDSVFKKTKDGILKFAVIGDGMYPDIAMIKIDLNSI